MTFSNLLRNVLTFGLLSGNEYPAIVEFSPFPKVPKKKAKKPDTKKGTIEQGTENIH